MLPFRKKKKLQNLAFEKLKTLQHSFEASINTKSFLAKRNFLNCRIRIKAGDLLLDAASWRFLKKILPLGGAGHHRAHPSQMIAQHTLHSKQTIILY
jgi:hypothetical protein